LAWAREHGVEIPAETRAGLVAQSHDEHYRKAGCCARCDHEDKALHSCRKCGDGEHQNGVGWVLGFQAQKCQGLTLLWVALGISVPAGAEVLWQFDWANAGSVCMLICNYSSFVSPPPLPPPRV
jgi:hypothetical protein